MCLLISVSCYKVLLFYILKYQTILISFDTIFNTSETYWCTVTTFRPLIDRRKAEFVYAFQSFSRVFYYIGKILKKLAHDAIYVAY